MMIPAILISAYSHVVRQFSFDVSEKSLVFASGDSDVYIVVPGYKPFVTHSAKKGASQHIILGAFFFYELENYFHNIPDIVLKV